MIRRTLIGFLLLFPSLLLLAQEAGEGNGEGGWTAPIWHVPMIAWQIVNLVLVVVLLVYLLRRPAPAFFASRAKEIQSLLEKAVKERDEATERLREVEEKMAHLGEEVADIERASSEAAEADEQRVREEAEASKEKIRKEAAEEMDRRVIEARRDLKTYAADLAIQMAKELVAREITEKDETSLRSRFLSLMEEKSNERSE